jgi:hypothetical protein
MKLHQRGRCVQIIETTKMDRFLQKQETQWLLPLLFTDQTEIKG